MSKLILTADDYGLNVGVNQATLESVRNKTITSVQVMVNFADEEQIKLLADTIDKAGNLCGIGLHFCTTVGPSLLQKQTSFTLKDHNGVYQFLDVKDWRYSVDADADMKEELTAQFNKLKGIIGSERIDSLSSHQNLHLFNLEYIKVIGHLAEDNWVPVRSPLRWNQDDTKNYPDGLAMQPIEDSAIKTLFHCKYPETKHMLLNGLYKDIMKKNRAILNDNKKTGGTPHTMCGHWYGQPKKRALNWIVQQLEEMRTDRPFYATEVLMHLSNSNEGDSPGQNYSMAKRLAEFNMLNSVGVKDFINALYTRKDFELGSYRKVLLGENIQYKL